ncbi:hypothetical protein BDK51DRAFT_42243 [Blyttiomyces helicus]|uniref:Uncharacterized protein n=1 Tax=Blyttiomyces helicus TaxID=388810 RepID=A0A4P9WK53_9FUNG|nr:hypothetical protein BDK51DRAFT_42243 [Blyttiomyces helicus]|eukprot:RKO93341.1 hypothetical protein BDK51DRAFT_42243 [Blyttiomyces helicus]
MYDPINHAARSAPSPLQSGRYYLLYLRPFPLETKLHEHAGVQTLSGDQKNLADGQSVPMHVCIVQSCDRDANGWFANVFLGTCSDHTLTKHNCHRFIAESPSPPLPNQPRPPLKGDCGGYICYTHSVRISILHGSPDSQLLDRLVAYQAAAMSSAPSRCPSPAELRRLVQAHVSYHAGVRYDDDGFAVPCSGDNAVEGGGRSRPVLSVSVAHAIDDALARGAAEVEERQRLMDPATKGQFVPLWDPREPSGLDYPVALLEPDVLHPLEIPHAITAI